MASRDSGLIHATEVLRNIPGISFTHFEVCDVLRHPLVQKVVEAYERHEATQQEKLQNKK